MELIKFEEEEYIASERLTERIGGLPEGFGLRGENQRRRRLLGVGALRWVQLGNTAKLILERDRLSNCFDSSYGGTKEELGGKRKGFKMVRKRETKVQGFVFSDLMFLCTSTSSTSKSKEGEGGGYKLIQSLGVVKIVQVIDLSYRTGSSPPSFFLIGRLALMIGFVGEDLIQLVYVPFSPVTPSCKIPIRSSLYFAFPSSSSAVASKTTKESPSERTQWLKAFNQSCESSIPKVTLNPLPNHYHAGKEGEEGGEESWWGLRMRRGLEEMRCQRIA